MRYKVTVTDNETNQVVREVEGDCIIATLGKEGETHYETDSIMALAGKRGMFEATVSGTLEACNETCTKMFGSSPLLDIAIAEYLEKRIGALEATEVPADES